MPITIIFMFMSLYCQLEKKSQMVPFHIAGHILLLCVQLKCDIGNAQSVCIHSALWEVIGTCVLEVK